MTTTALDHLSLGGRIDWLAQLDTAYHPEKNYRRTSIVRIHCTIMAMASATNGNLPLDLHNRPQDQLGRGYQQAPVVRS